MTQVLEFVGEPFDAVGWIDAGPVAATAPVPAEPPLPQALSGRTAAPESGATSVSMLARLRTTVVAAHSNALAAHSALQIRQLTRPRRAAWQGRGERGDAVRVGVGDVPTFKPLAFSPVNRLGADELARLSGAGIAGVFGPGYDQEDCNPDLRVAAGTELALAEVLAMRYLGNGRARMRVRCTPRADLVDAAAQAAEVFALYVGLHLCFADATFIRLDQDEKRVELRSDGNGTELDVEVEEIDLVPRPWLRVRARVGNTQTAVTVVVAVHEKPGVAVGPAVGGRPVRWLGRKSSLGERVLLNEFHMTHLCRGDQGIAFGPEFTHYTGRKATRLPGGGLMLLDRVVEVEGERGHLDKGAFITEYDSHADSWYYADSANDSMPNCVYVETASQASLLTGYYLGATLPTPDAVLSLRQLSGATTVLREVDLRGATIRQRSELVDTSGAAGSIVQSFTHVLSVHGEPFYAGETMFGYFSEEALAGSAGLDGGKFVPTWLESQRPAEGVRVIDVGARRADPEARLCSRNHLALVDKVTVVDGGGRYGKGYLHSQLAIDPDHWVFKWHFPLDPVMPGSFGMESIIQTMQEWLLDTDEARRLTDPGFVLPVGVPLVWKYRGQFEPTDQMATLEVHVKDVQTKPGRLRAIADASMWKPGLRIYQLTDVAVELREKGAEPW